MNIIFLFLLIILLFFLLAQYTGRKNFNEEKGMDELTKYLDIEMYDFILNDEKIHFFRSQIDSRSHEFMHMHGNGISLNIYENISIIEFEYTIQFFINGDYCNFTHYAEILDRKHPSSIYESYYYEDGDRSSHPAYDRFRIIAYWSISKLMKEFNDEYKFEVSFLNSVGVQKLDELKANLTFVVSLNC